MERGAGNNRQSEAVTANDIIHDLLANPYPYDLMRIRQAAENYFDEEEAMGNMEVYCTAEFAMKARADWQAAQDAAKEWLDNNPIEVTHSVLP